MHFSEVLYQVHSLYLVWIIRVTCYPILFQLYIFSKRLFFLRQNVFYCLYPDLSRVIATSKPSSSQQWVVYRLGRQKTLLLILLVQSGEVMCFCNHASECTYMHEYFFYCLFPRGCLLVRKHISKSVGRSLNVSCFVILFYLIVYS